MRKSSFLFGYGFIMQKMREILKLQLFDLTKHKLIRSRPIELSSLHAKLTNLSSEWKAGWISRLLWICTVNTVIFVFNLKKIIKIKFVQELCIFNNKFASAMPSAIKLIKGQLWEKTRVLCWSIFLSVYKSHAGRLGVN